LDDDRAVLVAAHRGPIRSGAPPELPRSPIAYAHLMRGAIDGNRWQSMAIDGNQWQ
jgi:hypothetical protein